MNADYLDTVVEFFKRAKPEWVRSLANSNFNNWVLEHPYPDPPQDPDRFGSPPVSYTEQELMLIDQITTAIYYCRDRGTMRAINEKLAPTGIKFMMKCMILEEP